MPAKLAYWRQMQLHVEKAVMGGIKVCEQQNVIETISDTEYYTASKTLQWY